MVDKVEYLRASYEGYLHNASIKFEVNLRAMLNVVALNPKIKREIISYFDSLSGATPSNVVLTKNKLMHWMFIASI